MFRILPDWTMEFKEKLDKVIKDLAAKEHIDLVAVNDSKSIDEAKSSIMLSLVRLYDNYNVEDRIRLEKFFKSVKVKPNKGYKKAKKGLTKLMKVKI